MNTCLDYVTWTQIFLIILILIYSVCVAIIAYGFGKIKGYDEGKKRRGVLNVNRSRMQRLQDRVR